MKLKTLAAQASVLALSASAYAATDGTLGPTSTGTADVSVTVEPAPAQQIQITDMQDLAFLPITEGDSSPRVRQALACVYSPEPLTYTFEATATNLTGQNTGEIVAYNINLAEVIGGSPDVARRVQTISGGSSAIQTGLASSQDVTCSDQQQLIYQARLGDDPNPVPSVPDTYSSTITILVTPE